jgi:hypothetical protein
MSREVYYRCPKCSVIGVIVTSHRMINCGVKGCRSWFNVDRNSCSVRDYERLWGLNIG